MREPVMSATERHALWALVRFRARALLHGWSLYIAAAGVLALQAALVGNFVSFVISSGVAVSRDPLQVPLALLLNLVAVYLALQATLGISREREQGTLLVLSFGPVTARNYLLGWLAAQAVAYVVFCAILLVGLAAIVAMPGLALSLQIVAFVALSALTAAAIVAFGLGVGAVSRDTRAAILIFLAISLLLVGIEAVHSYAGDLQPEQLTGLLLPASRVIGLVSSVLGWVSPFSYLPRGLNALFAGDWADFAQASGAALVCSAVFLLLARVGLERRGVQP